jgi:hypothetical protein
MLLRGATGVSQRNAKESKGSGDGEEEKGGVAGLGLGTTT